MLGNDTLFIGDKPHKFFSEAKIGGIPIFDLLPGVKNKFLKSTTKICLDYIFNLECFTLEDSYEVLMVTFWSTSILIDEEEHLVKVYISLIRNLDLLKLTKEDCNIYDLTEVAFILSRGINGNGFYGSEDFIRFKTSVFGLPQVNPLVCSVLLRDHTLIDKYLDDERSNKSEACVRAFQDCTIFPKIFDTISIKIFLCRELFLNMQDIYKYILSMKVF